MILHIYANYNKLGDFFSSPIIEKITPEEMVKDYAQIVCGLSSEYLKRLSECSLYCLGTFDNVSGEIVPEKTFLLHCNEVCSRFLKEEVKKEEVKSDVC